ncbi:C40 family peptidase [Agromyces sp. LHK192]|uniref:C40 family peptidase n=1 Tax=Agromyces sp. LHK192 TaxID=2498704 RepID=UPI000FD6BA6D|nr:C40 family peptidase [Agromyces sp. LHK192]
MARSPRRRVSGASPRKSRITAIRPRRRSGSTEIAEATAVPTPEARSMPAATTRPSSSLRLRRGPFANVAVIAVSAGIVGTLAIPAYAMSPDEVGLQFAQSDEARLTDAAAQSVDVEGDVIAAPVSTDGYAAVTGEEIRAAEQAAAEAAAAAERAAQARAAAEQQMTSYAASYSGPGVADLLANPPYPSFDLASVYNVATQYIGTPYVYGGSTPAGFDCSGFVMYVFAQFGIAMPHSSAGQGAMGTPISEADAVPGDLVIMSGHDGFYAGNGMILHAPYEGASVRVQPIWTSSYQIVRIGI